MNLSQKEEHNTERTVECQHVANTANKKGKKTRKIYLQALAIVVHPTAKMVMTQIPKVSKKMKKIDLSIFQMNFTPFYMQMLIKV